MVNPIDIRTLSGVRLDVYPTATVEVNMGGISLLNLQDRTATYTNSFKMPLTKTNEAVFEFASQPTRNNRPLIDVIVTKGLFQRQAVLKVIGFDKDYECSVTYNDVNTITYIKTTSEKTILNDYVLSTNKKIKDFILNGSNLGGSYIYNLHGFNSLVIPTDLTAINTRSLAISLSGFFSLITSNSGITFSGDLFSDSDFQKSYIMLYDSYIEMTPISIDPNDGLEIFDYKLKNFSSILISDIIKEVLFMFFSSISYVANEIIFTKINTSNSSILLDGFSSFSKKKCDYGMKNYIVYNISKLVSDKKALSDYFESVGTDEREIIKLSTYVPVGNNTATYYDLLRESDELIDKLTLATFTNDGTKNLTIEETSKVVLNSKKMSIFSLSGFYSSILNPIFANPVILEASRYFDPLTANQLMTDRVINSVQLGGRYWIDTMAYNLTTGQSKLTLIKLS